MQLINFHPKTFISQHPHHLEEALHRRGGCAISFLIFYKKSAKEIAEMLSSTLLGFNRFLKNGFPRGAFIWHAPRVDFGVD